MRTDRAKEYSIRNDLELETISVALPRLLVERLKRLGLGLDRSASSIIKQSLEGFLDGLGDSESERASDLGATLRRAGRRRLMRQRAAWSDD